jgi:hypothetical protein
MHSGATNKLHRFFASLRMTDMQFYLCHQRESVAGLNL